MSIKDAHVNANEPTTFPACPSFANLFVELYRESLTVFYPLFVHNNPINWGANNVKRKAVNLFALKVLPVKPKFSKKPLREHKVKQ
jgi:hypothetical protein